MTASSVIKRDWRAWTSVVKDYPGTGSPALSADCTGGKTAEFTAPSVAALCLSIARRAHKDALDRKKLLCSCEDSGALDARAFDYLESVMVSVTFSLAALEAFANAVIGQSNSYNGNTDVEAVQKGNVKEKRESFKGVSVLQWKLQQVLPVLLKKQAPVNEPAWKDYEAMEVLRNNWVIHPKTEWKEKGTNKTWNRNSKEFWYELLSADMPKNYPETAETLMKWFVGNLDCWLNRV